MNSKDNFIFLQSIHPELYSHLHYAEKSLFTDFYACGRALRYALECFISDIIHRENLTFKSSYSLFQKMSLLNDQDALAKTGYTGTFIKDKIPLPVGTPIVYLDHHGISKTSLNTLDYIRTIGNQCSHSTYKNDQLEVRLNFSNILKALEAFHQLLSLYYAQESYLFDKSAIPVNDYIITESYYPDDRTGCCREFKGYLCDCKGSPYQYAILRLYKKSDFRETCCRSLHCYRELLDTSPYLSPPGIPRIVELNTLDTGVTNFYILAYLFNSLPEPLSNSLLGRMSLSDRLDLCLKLSQSLYCLHHSEHPVCHRTLRPDCVVLTEHKKVYYPYLTRFDFAKIEKPNIRTTVYPEYSAAGVNPGFNLYRAPEIYRLDETSDIKDWIKADTFSLGLLISGILTADLSLASFSPQNMKRLGLCTEIIQLILRMLEEPVTRISLGEFIQSFTRISANETPI